jgi:predicted AAA+ superfamily ATPase
MAPYLRNPASRLIKSPKFYMSDAGLTCYLAEIENLTPDNPLRGAMVETYIAQNLMSILHSTWPRANIYFWNIQGRYEVDFVIESGNQCIAVEIKAAAQWGRNDLAGLKSFIAATPHCIAGILAYNGNTPACLGEKLWAIPFSLLLT